MGDITRGITFGATGSVTNTKLHALVDDATVNAGVITANKLATDAVETAKIKDKNVTTAKLADDAVTAAKLADNAVVAASILDKSITLDKIASAVTDDSLDNLMSDDIKGCSVTTADNGSTINVGIGSLMINGKIRSITADIDTNPSSDPDADDWLDVWLLADAESTAFTVSLVDSGTIPGGSSNPGTNGRMIGSVKHKGSGVYVQSINYRKGYIEGWSFFVGNDTASVSGDIVHGKTFNDFPIVKVSPLAKRADLSVVTPKDFNTGIDNSKSYYPYSITTTQFGVTIGDDSGTMPSGQVWGFTWRATGNFS